MCNKIKQSNNAITTVDVVSIDYIYCLSQSKTWCHTLAENLHFVGGVLIAVQCNRI